MNREINNQRDPQLSNHLLWVSISASSGRERERKEVLRARKKTAVEPRNPEATKRETKSSTIAFAGFAQRPESERGLFLTRVIRPSENNSRLAQ